MNNQKTTRFALTIAATAALLALAACGGGGGGSSGTSSGTSNSQGSSTGANTGTTSSTPASTSVPGTASTPQYAANSAEAAAFASLNSYRTECGFAAYQENTVLDTAAQNHSKYEGLNNVSTDTEVSGNAGYTGVTYAARATYAGFPQSVFATGASGGGDVVVSSTYDASQAGQQFVMSLLGGVYHNVIAAYPANIVGLGDYETQTTSGSYTYTVPWESISLASTQPQTLSNGPLTFPCQGVSGLPYREAAETPTPPNASSNGAGTPIVVVGNTTDTIVLQTATIAGPSGDVTVQILNATTDPNKELSAWQAVVYPTSPLQPNTQYSVSLTGTDNGTPFSRSFTFTTGSNVAG